MSFSTKNSAKLSVFLVKTLKIRGSCELCLQTPGCGPPLPNSGCATGQAYEVLSPPKFGAGYATVHLFSVFLRKVKRKIDGFKVCQMQAF